MPRIERNDQRRLPSQIAAGRVLGVGGGDIAASLENFGDEVMALHKRRTEAEQRREKLADEAEIADRRATAVERLTQALIEAETESAPDGADMLDLYESKADAAMSEVLTDMRSDNALAGMEVESDRLRARFVPQVMMLRAQRSSLFHVEQINGAVAKGAAGLVSSPGTLDLHLESLDDLTENLDGVVAPDRLAALRKSARNEYTRGAVTGLIFQSPGAALERLQAGEFDADLTAEQKTTFMVRAQSRLDAMATERASELKDRVNDTITGLKSGLSVVGAEQLAAQVSDPDDRARLLRWIAAQGDIEKMYARPADQRDAAVSDLLRGDVQPENVEVVQALVTAATKASREAATDPLQYYASRVKREPVPDFDDVETRERWAKAASAWTGKPAAPFTKSEIGQLRQSLDAAATSIGELAALEEYVGDYSPRTQLALAAAMGRDAPEYGAAIALFSSSNLAEQNAGVSILRGRKFLKDVRATDSDIAGAMSDYQEVFKHNPSALQFNIRAAKAVYADMMAQSGTLPSDVFKPDVWRKAMRVVVGDPITYNGSLILPPTRDVTDSDFRRVMGALTDEDLKTYGASLAVLNGVYTPMATLPTGGGVADAPLVEITADEVREEGRLFVVQDGRYAVRIGTGLAQGSEQGVYVLDLRRYVEEKGIPGAAPVREIREKNPLAGVPLF